MKNNNFIIPEELKRRKKITKFSYIALRNLLYYIEKGIRTQGKITRDYHNNTINEFIKNYFKCHKDNKSLTNEDCKLIQDTIIKNCFSSHRQILIPKDDYFLKVEKELMFQKFAFYCNCFIEASFHVNKDYFDVDFVSNLIDELSDKTLIKLNSTFKDIIVNDIIKVYEAI